MFSSMKTSCVFFFQDRRGGIGAGDASGISAELRLWMAAREIRYQQSIDRQSAAPKHGCEAKNAGEAATHAFI